MALPNHWGIRGPGSLVVGGGGGKTSVGEGKRESSDLRES